VVAGTLVAKEKNPRPTSSLGQEIYAIMVPHAIFAFHSISSFFGVNSFLWS
jgi:hypothetical protein